MEQDQTHSVLAFHCSYYLCFLKYPTFWTVIEFWGSKPLSGHSSLCFSEQQFPCKWVPSLCLGWWAPCRTLKPSPRCSTVRRAWPCIPQGNAGCGKQGWDTLVTSQTARGRDVPGVLLLNHSQGCRGSCCSESQGSTQLSQCHWEAHRDPGDHRDGSRDWRAVPEATVCSRAERLFPMTSWLLLRHCIRVTRTNSYMKTKPTSHRKSIFQKGIIILICQLHLLRLSNAVWDVPLLRSQCSGSVSGAFFPRSG